MKKARGNARFVSHIFILLICVIIAVVATFSWYNRSPSTNEESAGFLSYTQSGNISGNGCEVKTYAGTYTDGDVSYSTDELTSEIITEPGSLSYFKTVITDSSTDPNAKSYVSVYLENFSYSSTMGNEIHIGLTKPEKTYKQFTGNISESNFVIDSLCLEDNILINSGSTIEIYWFVEIDGSYSGSGSITPGTLHVVYN